MNETVVPYIMKPAVIDFDLIHSAAVEQLLNSDTSEGAWRDLLQAATGSFILRFGASIGHDAVFSVERAQHEIFSDTARRPSSIYAIARTHGVHIQRAQPASIPVRVMRPLGVNSIFKIPEYSQWNVGGYNCFNRTDLFFSPQAEFLDVTLHVGTVTTEQRTSDGTDFQTYLIGNKDFGISDVDIFATVDNGATKTKYTATHRGLWEYIFSDNVFFENTHVDGRVEVRFGNGVYGSKPGILDTISFHYVVVNTDIVDETTIPIGSPVYVSGFANIIANTIGYVGKNLPARGVEFYRALSPAIRDMAYSITNRENYRAAALGYPGVIDAKFEGQAEINPADIRWMCGIRACVLTISDWTDPDWNVFINYLNSRGIPGLYVFRRKAEEVPVDFSLHLKIYNRADPVYVEAKAKELICTMLEKKEGCLGASYDMENVSAMLKKEIVDPYGGLVHTAVVKLPTQSIVLSPYQWASVTPEHIKVTYDYIDQDKIRIVGGTSVKV